MTLAVAKLLRDLHRAGWPVWKIALTPGYTEAEVRRAQLEPVA